MTARKRCRGVTTGVLLPPCRPCELLALRGALSRLEAPALRDVGWPLVLGCRTAPAWRSCLAPPPCRGRELLARLPPAPVSKRDAVAGGGGRVLVAFVVPHSARVYATAAC